MARTAALIALLIVVGSVCLDACMACGECGGAPTVPVYKPPKTPKPPKAPAKKPPPKAPTSPAIARTCPVDVLQLSVCSPLLGGIVGGLLPPSNACCALLNLLGVDLELCLCLAIDANVLGLISINAKVDAVVSILTSCGYKVPPKFSCPHY